MVFFKYWGSVRIKTFNENVIYSALHSDYFRGTISAMNICPILKHYRYGCLNIPCDFYCASDCRETDFTERSSLASVSDSCAGAKSGGCCWLIHRPVR